MKEIIKKTQTKTLSNLRIDADESIKEINQAVLDDSFKGIGIAKEKLESAVKEYNSLSIVMEYNKLASKKKPMLAAIEQYEIAIIAIKINKDKETDRLSYSLEPATRQIDLVAFEDFCKRDKKEIAHDNMWRYKSEKFNLLVAYRTFKELGKDTKKMEDAYYISEVAKAINMGKTPTSKTQIQKMLQEVVNGIIFEDDGNGNNAYKVTSHDVAYILLLMSKKGKVAQSVAIPRTSSMNCLIFDVVNRIVENKEYTVEYTTKKQAKEEEEQTKELKEVA